MHDRGGGRGEEEEDAVERKELDGGGWVMCSINACGRCLPCSFQGRTRKCEVVEFTATTLY